MISEKVARAPTANIATPSLELGGQMALLNDLPLDRLVPEDEAFDAIYREFKPALLAFCRARLTDRSEAEDACQEALLRAYRSLPRFDRTQRLWPWLATIAANVCTDMRRKKQAVPLSACDSDPRAGRTIDPTDELEARSRARLVASALHHLPEGQRRQVYLADAEGWSYADIATSEQRSVASVRTSLMRGRSAFRVRARALAEDKGMWPLSALPFAGLRSLLRKAVRGSQLTASASPVAVGALQVAAAALVFVGALVPVTGALASAHDAASGRASALGPNALVVADRLEHEPAPEPQAAPLLPVAPPATTTDVDLEGDLVVVQASADVSADEDRDATAFTVLTLNCGAHDGRLCDLVELP